MKNLIVVLIFLTSCSGIEVHPAGSFVDLSTKDLTADSKASFKASGVDNFIPKEIDRNDYFTSLQNIPEYRNYLIIECARLLSKEHGLNLQKPIYTSTPKWNNVQNWYYTIFNFQTQNSTEELSMECDLAVDKSKEVSEYQLNKSYTKLIKNRFEKEHK